MGKTVIIGLDGVPYHLIDNLSDKGVMPNFKNLKDKGIFKEMESAIPEISSVSWSSIITGVNPGEHGIFGFMDMIPGTYTMSFPNFNSIKASAFWQTMDGTHAIINVPSTYPAKPMNGFHVAGFVALDLENAVYPQKYIPMLEDLDYRIDVDSEKGHSSKELFFKDLHRTLDARQNTALHLWDESKWDTATESLKKAVEAEGLEYEVDEGGGAFYGPKIDLKIKDAMGRSWQLSTIQFDFNLPERFKMTFVDHDGQEKQPFMVHRALLGSIERFFGVLLEHYAGAFPVWLSPVQAMVIPVATAFDDYARKVEETLREAGIRVAADMSDQRMNAKIRNAQNQKIPYMIVIGEKEAEAGAISIRLRTGKQTNGIPLDEGIAFIKEKIEKKEEL